MHAADTSLRKPRRTALMLVGVRARRETTLAVAALAAISAHLLDDNLFQPQPGTAPADHFVSTAVPLAALLAFAAAYPLLRSGLRAAIAIPVGLLGIVAGVAEAGYYSLHGGPSGDRPTRHPGRPPPRRPRRDDALDNKTARRRTPPPLPATTGEVGKRARRGVHRPVSVRPLLRLHALSARRRAGRQARRRPREREFHDQ